MADNVTLPYGPPIRTVNRTADGLHRQVMAFDGGGGADGNAEAIWTMGAAVTAASMPVTLASDQIVQVSVTDGSGNKIASQSYIGVAPGGGVGNALAVDPTYAATDDIPYSVATVPQVAVIAGHGGGHVDSLNTDGAGNLSVSDTTLRGAQTSDAPIFAVIAGDPSGDFAGVNLLEQVMDANSGHAFHVRLQAPVVVDPTSIVKVNDGTSFAFTIPGGGATTLPVDCSQYSSVSVTASASNTVTLAFSNDGVTGWTTASLVNGAGTVVGTGTVVMNTTYTGPVRGKFVRVTAATTAAAVTLVLKFAAFSFSDTNVAGIGGTTVVSAGVAGMMPVGGNIAPGTARTANPVPISGVDASNLTRTILTDTSGRPQIAGVDGGGVGRGIGTTTPSGLQALVVDDAAQTDGGLRVQELLALILFELRIANQQRHDMMLGVTNPDPPDAYRADPGLFN